MTYISTYTDFLIRKCFTFRFVTKYVRLIQLHIVTHYKVRILEHIMFTKTFLNILVHICIVATHDSYKEYQIHMVDCHHVHMSEHIVDTNVFLNTYVLLQKLVQTGIKTIHQREYKT
jgi:hypothetical protein